MTEQKNNLMLFYKNIVALSRDDHKATYFSPARTLEFAAGTHWVPVAGSEFAALSRGYPIIFVREEENEQSTISPIALLGLTVAHNDYLNADMTWRADTYIPAFIRRYPFVPATAGAGSEKLTICIDADAPHFKEVDPETEKPKALFDTQGEPTQFLQEIIQFLQGFQVEMQRTKQFVDKLREYDLLTQRNAEIHGVGGSVFKIADMLIVDEEKLNGLTGEQLADLAHSGVLGWIYAHLLSLHNLPLLLSLHQQRVGASIAAQA